MIVIVDYGMGNSGSILNMLKKVGVSARISSSVDEIDAATKIILPGVGAFDNGIRCLRERKLDVILEKKVLGDGTPILGICLGMQLFTKSSEEGSEKGLGWIDADTVKFRIPPEESALKVPHMGWNAIEIVKNSVLFDGMYDEPRFYFVHSYHVQCAQHGDELTRTQYCYPFTSAVQKDNIYGTQFHPEKSHKFGLKVLNNFAELA